MSARNRVLLAVVLAFVTLAPGVAFARPRPARGPVHHVYGPGPAVVVRVNPWVVGYSPGPRPGWIWVAGHYDPRHVWIPGFWTPAAPRAGWLWVPGYWSGPDYVEGSWREEARSGWSWVDGYYEGQSWVEGHWEPAGAQPASGTAPATPEPPPPDAPLAIPVTPDSADVHHDY